MIGVNIYSGTVSAEMFAGKYRFYYGEDYISPDSEEWCFVAFINDKEKMRIKSSDLDEVACGGAPSDYLLAGIAKFLSR